MNCKNCNAYLENGAKFCTNCGATVTDVAANGGSPAGVLVWGILALSFACTFWLSLLGIIFAGVAKGKAKSYIAAYGEGSKQVNIGKGLATAGMIVGIIFCVLFVFYIVIIAAAAMM